MCKQKQAVLRMLLCFSLCAVLLVAVPAHAADSCTGDMEVRFRQGTAFQLYFAATQTENGFEAAGKFAQCPVKIDINNAEDMRTLASTLFSLVTQGRLAPDEEAVTDSSGKAVFSDLAVGLYLLVSPGTTSPTVVSVIARGNVVVEPKEDSGTQDKTVALCVVKTWMDQGYESSRPASIQAELYQDGVLLDTVTLSAQNGWIYTWNGLPSGYSYTVAEKSVPEDYTVSISQDGDTFLVENTRKTNDTSSEPSTPETPSDTIDTPKMGDEFSPAVYGSVAAVSAAVLVLLVALKIRSKNAQERE